MPPSLLSRQSLMQGTSKYLLSYISMVCMYSRWCCRVGYIVMMNYHCLLQSQDFNNNGEYAPIIAVSSVVDARYKQILTFVHQFVSSRCCFTVLTSWCMFVPFCQFYFTADKEDPLQQLNDANKRQEDLKQQLAAVPVLIRFENSMHHFFVQHPQLNWDVT